MSEGYGFVLALTRAIEAWSAAVTAADASAFTWRGENLQYAAERSLFFELVHDERLRRSFRDSGSFDVSVEPVGLGRRLRYELANIARLLRRPVETARLCQKPDILFFVIHPKFVTFFDPIVRELGDRAAYLTVQDPVTEAHLAKMNLPSVSVRLAFSPFSVPRGLLAHFLGLTRTFDLMCALFSRSRPQVIVVPEGNAPLYEIAHRAGARHGVATICLQHGAPAYTNPGFRNWTFENMLVWGSLFIEPFAKYNPQQRFTAVGTPADFGTPRPRGVEAIRTIGFFLQKAAENIPLSEWDAMLDLIGWVARSFPDITVIVREHPTQPRLDSAELSRLGLSQNLRFMSPPEFGLGEVLSQCDVVVAGASTTLLEAIAVGAIPLVFGTSFSSDFPQIVSLGAGISARTLDEAKAVVARLAEDLDLRARLRGQGAALRPELFLSHGPEGARCIAQFLKEFCDTKLPDR